MDSRPKTAGNDGWGKVSIGVIGGSGVYAIEELRNVREVRIKTPFGDPSDALILGQLEGVDVAFLPRHARGHRINPSEVNHRANIFALKSIGVEQIISVAACGSLREELRPRDMVFPDQLFDRTKSRPSTFFEKGIVAHVGMAHPYCGELSSRLYQCAKSLGFSAHRGGTYVCMEGPQFSTKAESNVYRTLGFSVIGMTAIPEAKLAREAEICYSSVALVTDYDVWKDEPVTVEMVIGNLTANTANVKRLLKEAITKLSRPRGCGCAQALRYAILTDRKLIPAKIKRDLRPLIGKYIES
ncbi:MAG: S-methyl-5'-thioadenosine phosphorylase [Elusimicrobiota bacterium]